MSIKTSAVKIEESWKIVLANEFQETYFLAIKSFLIAEKKAGKTIYPPNSLIFNAFNSTPFNEVNVVILGQDPYHGPNQAMGLSFSVPPELKTPASLRNIYKELAANIDGFEIPKHGDLSNWSTQGVFMLNAMLTIYINFQFWTVYSYFSWNGSYLHIALKAYIYIYRPIRPQ